MEINLYPEMNSKIAGILRINDENPTNLYAAALIEHLQSENAQLRSDVALKVKMIEHFESDRDVWKRRAEAAEPRLLTLQEVRCYEDAPFLWVEKLAPFSENDIDGRWEASVTVKYKTERPYEPDSLGYGILWRAWTGKPTSDQSMSAPWDGPRDEGKED
jgi:hypothetical protein